MNKILFLLEFTPFESTMSGVRVSEIMKYLINNGWVVFSFSCVNHGSVFKKYYKKHTKNFKFYLLSGKSYINKNKIIKLILKLILAFFALRYVKEIIVNNKINKIWISTPKIFPLFLAFILKTFYFRKIEIVLEYRDVWSLNVLFSFSKYKRFILYNIEKILISKVSKFIFATSKVKETYLINFAKKIKAVEHGLILYTGFNPAYYKHNIVNYNKLVFTYSGSFDKERDPLFFLNALNDFFKNNSYDFTNVLRVNLIVNYFNFGVENFIKDSISKLEIKSSVKILKNIKHRKVINILDNSNIMLLICHNKGHEDSLPGKFSEYVGTRKNILAISNDPLVIEAICNDRLGILCNIGDYSRLYNILKEIYFKWSTKNINYDGNYENYSVLERFKSLNNFLLN